MKTGATKSRRVKGVKAAPATAAVSLATEVVASVQHGNLSPAVLGMPVSASSPVSMVPVVNTQFILPLPKERHVALCGTFSGWSPIPMQWNEGGYWEASVALAPGRYEYKFMLDGEWIPDPIALDHVFNTFGTLNSIITVK